MIRVVEVWTFAARVRRKRDIAHHRDFASRHLKEYVAGIIGDGLNLDLCLILIATAHRDIGEVVLLAELVV